MDVSSPRLVDRRGLTIVLKARKSKLVRRAVGTYSCAIGVPVSRNISSLGITTTDTITF